MRNSDTQVNSQRIRTIFILKNLVFRFVLFSVRFCSRFVLFSIRFILRCRSIEITCNYLINLLFTVFIRHLIKITLLSLTIPYLFVVTTSVQTKHHQRKNTIFARIDVNLYKRTSLSLVVCFVFYLWRIYELMPEKISTNNIKSIRRLWSFIQEMIAKNDNLINLRLILEKERNGFTIWLLTFSSFLEIHRFPKHCGNSFSHHSF